jgi:uncharacterized membrane-anchored protein
MKILKYVMFLLGCTALLSLAAFFSFFKQVPGLLVLLLCISAGLIYFSMRPKRMQQYTT